YAPDYEPPGPLYSVESLFRGVRRFSVQPLAGPKREIVFVPQGSDWFPKRVIEIFLLGEPKFDGDEVVTGLEWTLLGAVTADSYGTYGYDSSDIKAENKASLLRHVVQRDIPGFPPQWLSKPIFLAREEGSAAIRTSTVGNDYWFTFQQP